MSTSARPRSERDRERAALTDVPPRPSSAGDGPQTDEATLLDPLTLPLDGTRLIEASAGTGKTWTIAALVLRLVLGHPATVPAGDESPAPPDAEDERAARPAGPTHPDDIDPARGLPPLQPAQILVMTFTRAATRELADRVRQRLVQAAAVFRGDAGAPAPDALLQALLDQYPAGSARESAAHRLAMAAEAMDDAAVLTIDAWCQRMLREHAFDSGCLFDEDLQADDRAMRQAAAADFWRREVYPLSDAAMQMLQAQWPGLSLARLLPDLGEALTWLTEGDEAQAGPPADQAQLADLLGACADALPSLKAGWADRFEALRQSLLAVLSGPGKTFNGNKLRASSVRDHLQAWIDWACEPQALLPDGFDDGLAGRYTPQWLAERLNKGQTLPPQLPKLCDGLEALTTELQRLSGGAVALRRHAAQRIARRYRELQRETRAFGFSDLLRRLDQALDVERHGDRARRLRARILQQTPVALVDEFQDTSPVQLSIFHRLYDLADAGGHGRALLLIGDPKQSIYRFRGADIHSYLQARRATRGRHHRLGTNHRSTQAVVDVVNALFQRAEQRPGPGAFLMRSAPTPRGGDLALPLDSSAPPEGELPFVPVAARGRAEHLVSRHGPVPPLIAAFSATPMKARPQLRRMAEAAANQIADLLGDPKAGFAQPDKPFRRLRPADVAVLVRTGREAAVIRRELARRAVASVYLSDQESVLASSEAVDLLRLLQAVAQPRDVRLARAALATGLLGLTLDELQCLAEDDERLDAQLDRLALLQGVWQQQGVLSMLRRLLHLYELPARWLGAAVGEGASPEAAAGAHGGERRLTNVLHLAELLQQAATTVEGEGALVRWLAQTIETVQRQGGRAADEQVLRLESDADLVQVVTIHKSKGLEYPVVFLPFVVQHRSLLGGGPRPPVVVLPDGAGGNRVVLSPGNEDLHDAERERLREDLRLLYVALTRARHALWLGLVPIDSATAKATQASTRGWSASAIGRLISGEGDSDSPEAVAEAVGQALRHWPGAAWQSVTADAQPAAAVEPAAADASVADATVADEPTVDASLTGWATAPAQVPVWPAPPPRRLVPDQDVAPLAAAPTYAARFERDWGIGSYSALVASAVAGAAPAGPVEAALEAALARWPAGASDALGDIGGIEGIGSSDGDAEAQRWADEAGAADAPAPSPEGDRMDAAAAGPAPGRLSGRGWLDDEPQGPDPIPAATQPGSAGAMADAPWHRFPRGALAGHVLHGLLEALAGEGFAPPDAPQRAQALRLRCERQGWGARADDLIVWLSAVCRAPIAALGGTPLRGLGATLPEMEFWTPADGLDTRRLDRLCRQHLWPGQERPALSPRRLQGLLMGFADLCFMHDGRAWVADYKSNALGPSDAAYTEAAMALAVRHHRYDVQAALYQFALHRLLRLRLGQSYRPEQHLGGTLFLFLRGIQGPEGGVLHVPPLVPVMQALDDMLASPVQEPS